MERLRKKINLHLVPSLVRYQVIPLIVKLDADFARRIILRNAPKTEYLPSQRMLSVYLNTQVTFLFENTTSHECLAILNWDKLKIEIMNVETELNEA